VRDPDMIHYRRNSVTEPEWLVESNKKQANDNLLAIRYNECVTDNLGGINWKDSDKKKWKNCKPLLGEISHWKCPYCDTGNIGQGDVEHFRPKNNNSYWWLAFTWENLLLACPDCNRVFKNRKFPLASGGVEARQPGDSLVLEKHLLINPLDEDPEPLFVYEIRGDEVDIKTNNSETSANQMRAHACIELFDLNNRPSIHRARRKAKREFNFILGIYRKAATRGILDIIQDTENGFRGLSKANEQCAGMIRFFMSQNGFAHLIV
jgi:uncharacterized protein (TIGR02646 family)